ncbi:hypothetical protein BD289DRAFT_369793 [Coniella lustricola]|uniref:UBZ4-type domain-containing protein n=1 Tax=Coniella lustricola TaxID=2025994 RepID=A0A2T3A627_9PEZI|nr:hypothetical protein BD289DRAFT_369793 [Coniella lustricola]
MDRRRHPAVPTTASVIPGATVNIVLKADQPTGRTVSGVVRDLLTRGNHPRGIKVRLADGRVGRVQSMASASSASTAAAQPSTGGAQGGRGDDGVDGQELPTQQLGLDAYVKQSKPRQKGKAEQTAASKDIQESTAPTETTTCPVCGAFEGDEVAVSHHVATHFES